MFQENKRFVWRYIASFLTIFGFILLLSGFFFEKMSWPDDWNGKNTGLFFLIVGIGLYLYGSWKKTIYIYKQICDYRESIPLSSRLNLLYKNIHLYFYSLYFLMQFNYLYFFNDEMILLIISSLFSVLMLMLSIFISTRIADVFINNNKNIFFILINGELHEVYYDKLNINNIFNFKIFKFENKYYLSINKIISYEFI